jgi:hypothetical protein
MSEEQARAQSGRRGIGQSQLQHQQPLLSREYVAHQMGHTTLEMIIRHYARWMRKLERVGRLAEQLASNSRQLCQK